MTLPAQRPEIPLRPTGNRATGELAPDPERDSIGPPIGAQPDGFQGVRKKRSLDIRKLSSQQSIPEAPVPSPPIHEPRQDAHPAIKPSSAPAYPPQYPQRMLANETPKQTQPYQHTIDTQPRPLPVPPAELRPEPRPMQRPTRGPDQAVSVAPSPIPIRVSSALRESPEVSSHRAEPGSAVLADSLWSGFLLFLATAAGIGLAHLF